MVWLKNSHIYTQKIHSFKSGKMIKRSLSQFTKLFKSSREIYFLEKLTKISIAINDNFTGLRY